MNDAAAPNTQGRAGRSCGQLWLAAHSSHVPRGTTGRRWAGAAQQMCRWRRCQPRRHRRRAAWPASKWGQSRDRKAPLNGGCTRRSGGVAAAAAQADRSVRWLRSGPIHLHAGLPFEECPALTWPQRSSSRLGAAARGALRCLIALTSQHHAGGHGCARGPRLGALAVRLGNRSPQEASAALDR